MSNARCTVKYTHNDGLKLDKPLSWCGRNISGFEWSFLDAQHLALSCGGSVQPCKKCIKAVIDCLSVEID